MALNITHKQAGDRLIMFAKEQRLEQNTFHGIKPNGRETACILGAFDTRVQEAKDCNAHLMPLWMAKVTITLFDNLDIAHIHDIGLSYGRLVRRWHVLTEEQWRSVLGEFLVANIKEAVKDCKKQHMTVERHERKANGAVFRKYMASVDSVIAAIKSKNKKRMRAVKAKTLNRRSIWAAYDFAKTYSSGEYVNITDVLYTAQCAISALSASRPYAVAASTDNCVQQINGEGPVALRLFNSLLRSIARQINGRA